MVASSERAEAFISKAIATYERIIYARNPLVNVVCQLRFPTMLSLDSPAASKLQDALSDEFPIIELGQAVNVSVGATEGPFPSTGTSKILNYYTFNREWQFSLANNSISLSTGNYVSWDEFRNRLSLIIEQLYNAYKIPVCDRIGLRYQDVIDREALGVANKGWPQLISAPLLGIFQERDIDDSFLEHTHSANTFKFGVVKLLLQYGMFPKINDSGNIYLIDSDFYIDERRAIAPPEIIKDLENLHNLAGPIFRWAITEELHNALRTA